MMAIDTETTGLDLFHAARPFFVTTCDAEGNQRWWEWPVDPLTRTPRWDGRELAQVRVAVKQAAELIGQNIKFDAIALSKLPGWNFPWPWAKTRCTLIAAHLLNSGMPRKDLTTLALERVGWDIEPFERELKAATQEARQIVKREFPEWKLAKAGTEGMPSAKGGGGKKAKGTEDDSPWRFDCWVPLALANELGLSASHPFRNVLREYANADSLATMLVWKSQAAEIADRKLGKLFAFRMKLDGVIENMQQRGMTVNGKEHGRMLKEFAAEVETCGNTCVALAEHWKDADGRPWELSMPKGSVNDSLKGLVFGPMGIKPLAKTEKGNPKFDSKSVARWAATATDKRQRMFFSRLVKRGKAATACSYLEGYRRFWLPTEQDDWFLLHSELNMTGTKTLRCSSNNPNQQNVSKSKDPVWGDYNLRRCFGPAPGREWWSFDAQNLELRIPSFIGGEQSLIEVFNHPERAPYFGSYHLVVFDLLHPELFKQHGKACKALYESTLYQWVKNGNFAIIYGAQQATADAAYHFEGAYDLIRQRFPMIARLNDRMIETARKQGWVATVPDLEVDPTIGYPLTCLDEYGGVSPTVPLNYFVQGTACWWMGTAMVRVEEKLREWRQAGFDGWMICQVHDELVLDFPKAACPKADPKRSNLRRAKEVAALMERSGTNIGVPTPVSIEYHPESWATSTVI